MLKQILQTMAAGDVYSYAELARQLNISEDLLSRMLQELAHKGYLSPLDAEDAATHGCSGTCGSCKVHCAVSSASAMRQGWALTAKGRAAAKPTFRTFTVE